MKKVLFFIIMSLPIIVNAQKIKESEFDKFVKSYRIETSKSTLKMGLSKGLSVSYRSVGSAIFLNLSGYNFVTTGVNTDDQAIFLLDNDSTITVLSKDLQFAKPFKYGQSFDFEYRISDQNTTSLASANIIGIRFYASGGYTDVSIDSKESKKINELTAVFLKEYNSKKNQF